VIHTLPRDWSSLAQVLTPVVERIDPMQAAVQVLVITPDVESTVALVAGAFAHFGVQGIDVLPATSAQRAARLLRTDPARAVAGPPGVLRDLLSASALRLDSVRGTVFAWVDEIIQEGGAPLADLEAVLAETPKDAIRVLVTREITGAIEQFIKGHLHHARGAGPTAGPATLDVPTAYVTTALAARPSALRRVLDQLDPPSATVVVRTHESETEAKLALRQLGYRRTDDVVRVSRGEVPANNHTVILYDPPVSSDLLASVSRSNPTQIVSLVEAADVRTLKRLTGNRAYPLPPARRSLPGSFNDEMLRKELRALLDAGLGGREVAAIEPLLAEYDAGEIAGALVRLVERERESRLTREQAPPSASQTRDDRRGGLRDRTKGRSEGFRGREGERPTGGFRQQREGGARDFAADRSRESGQRGERSFGGSRPRGGATRRPRGDEDSGRGERGQRGQDTRHGERGQRKR
jgi:ATP-dependent RNA helicase DeaD